MAKYTYEFKKKVVNDYLNGRGGYGFLAKTYGIPSKKMLKNGYLIIKFLVITVSDVQEKKRVILSKKKFLL